MQNIPIGIVPAFADGNADTELSDRLLQREEGGTALSFGSDAHLPGYVGERFREAAGRAEAAGFRPGRDPFDFWRG